MGYLTGVVGFKAIIQIFGETGIVTGFIVIYIFIIYDSGIEPSGIDKYVKRLS